jgi:hypothetical protein
MAAPATTQHQWLIYEGSPTSQLPALAAVAKHKLEAGRRCLVLNSPAMVARFLSHLAAFAVDVVDEVYKGAVILIIRSGPTINVGLRTCL